MECKCFNPHAISDAIRILSLHWSDDDDGETVNKQIEGQMCAIERIGGGEWQKTIRWYNISYMIARITHIVYSNKEIQSFHDSTVRLRHDLLVNQLV